MTREEIEDVERRIYIIKKMQEHHGSLGSCESNANNESLESLFPNHNVERLIWNDVIPEWLIEWIEG